MDERIINQTARKKEIEATVIEVIKLAGISATLRVKHQKIIIVKLHLTEIAFSGSVVFVSISNPNDMPAINSETPVVHTSPKGQLLQSRMLILFFLLAILLVGIIITVLFRNSQPQKTSQPTARFSQAPQVDLKIEYKNPFNTINSKSENPFESYKNPFENLK